MRATMGAELREKLQKEFSALEQRQRESFQASLRAQEQASMQWSTQQKKFDEREMEQAARERIRVHIEERILKEEAPEMERTCRAVLTQRFEEQLEAELEAWERQQREEKMQAIEARLSREAIEWERQAREQVETAVEHKLRGLMPDIVRQGQERMQRHVETTLKTQLTTIQEKVRLNLEKRLQTDMLAAEAAAAKAARKDCGVQTEPPPVSAAWPEEPIPQTDSPAQAKQQSHNCKPEADDDAIGAEVSNRRGGDVRRVRELSPDYGELLALKLSQLPARPQGQPTHQLEAAAAEKTRSEQFAATKQEAASPEVQLEPPLRRSSRRPTSRERPASGEEVCTLPVRNRFEV
eukprot:TRINITY_DN11835_c0_g1_i2.p1 TRINITY_DN11835_c0_g1~~TRINITY_DN11835_c0_g1_i2.p1  ORF type:complete len:351 (+),score=123.78 TRINITY_DN11835_c0_g1_i2:762-1814(+)